MPKQLRQCPHGFHHPMPGDLSYPHSCDGCWCEGLRDRRDYGWQHDTTPDVRCLCTWNVNDFCPIHNKKD